MSSDRDELRQALGVPPGAPSFLDDAIFYRLDLKEPYSQVLGRLQEMESQLNARNFYLAEQRTDDARTSYTLYIASRGQPLTIGALLIRNQKDATRIDGIGSEVNSAAPFYAWYKDFWAMLQSIGSPISAAPKLTPDVVIEKYNRAHGQNRKITLKQVCDQLGVSYEAVRKYRSRTKKPKTKK